MVETSPGLKEKTSNSGYSALIVVVKNSPYALVALYTLKYGVGNFPAKDVTLTIADLYYFLYKNLGINLLQSIVIGKQLTVIVLYIS